MINVLIAPLPCNYGHSSLKTLVIIIFHAIHTVHARQIKHTACVFMKQNENRHLERLMMKILWRTELTAVAAIRHESEQERYLTFYDK